MAVAKAISALFRIHRIHDFAANTRCRDAEGAEFSIDDFAANTHRRDAEGAEFSIDDFAANTHRRDAEGAELSIYLAANAAPLR